MGCRLAGWHSVHVAKEAVVLPVKDAAACHMPHGLHSRAEARRAYMCCVQQVQTKLPAVVIGPSAGAGAAAVYRHVEEGEAVWRAGGQQAVAEPVAPAAQLQLQHTSSKHSTV